MVLIKRLAIVLLLICACSISWALDKQHPSTLVVATQIKFQSIELLNAIDENAQTWDF